MRLPGRALLTSPETWRDWLREAAIAGLVVLPTERRRRLDRRWRGRDELRRLALADAVVVSYGKSGRTWLRVMLSRFWQQRHGLPEGVMLELDNLHRLDRRVPVVLFSHANYTRDVTGRWDARPEYHDRRTVLLLRDPLDIAVSQYFQWRHRMRPWKKTLNDYPAHGADVPLFDFVMDERCGLPAIVAWLAVFERELPLIREHTVVAYEAMRADAAAALREVLGFLGQEPSDAEIADAVAFGSLENMRAMERAGAAGFLGRRMRPGSADLAASGLEGLRVGGWRDSFTPDEIRAIEAWARARAPLPFGYGIGAPAGPIRETTP
jgi:hypothetical protein